MIDREEHQPGTRAPITGRFEELNIFGSPTGKVEHVPPAPQGNRLNKQESRFRTEVSEIQATKGH
jgi:hypothetical protein